MMICIGNQHHPRAYLLDQEQQTQYIHHDGTTLTCYHSIPFQLQPCHLLTEAIRHPSDQDSAAHLPRNRLVGQRQKIAPTHIRQHRL